MPQNFAGFQAVCLDFMCPVHMKGGENAINHQKQQKLASRWQKLMHYFSWRQPANLAVF